MVDVNSTKRHAKEILRLLDEVESDLNSARGWGIFDIFGGKSISSMVKHSKINKAEVRLKTVTRELQVLQRELNQIDLNIDHKINAGNFNKFMDIFTDSSIADFYTQSKINDGRRRVKDLKITVQNIYDDLNRI